MDDSTYIELFANEQRQDGLKEGTIETRTRIVRRVQKDLGISLDDLSQKNIKQWLAARGITEETKRQYVLAIGEFYRWGIRHRFFEKDPAEGLTYNRATVDPDEISDKDVATLMTTTTSPEVHFFLALMAYQGLTVIEVTLLTVEEIDLKSQPKVLKIEKGSDKAPILHPEVLASLDAFTVPDRGRIFPKRKPHNISHMVGDHFEKCGVKGSAKSLTWWYRNQVSVVGKKFGRRFEACEIDEYERRIIEALDREVPSAAICYRQALLDLNDESRISFRGVANEMREALREVLDTLAPDDAVMSSDWFKLEKDQSKPTQAQKTGYIIRTRTHLSKTARLTDESAVDTIESLIGKLSRAVYSRSSGPTHTESDRGAVQAIKGHLNPVLADIFEIHRS